MNETFSTLGIKQELLAALARQSIAEPTPVQIAAIPVLLQKANAYVQAETGTGKTLAYLLPLYTMVDSKLDNIQAIVVAPTHELAIQIQRQCTELAQGSGLPVRVMLLIGGTQASRQLEKLKKKPHIVVGSPGRIRELVDTRKLKVHKVQSIVVDEADRLLASESLEDLQVIIKATPGDRNLIFVSATEHPEVTAIVESLSPGMQRIKTAQMPVNQHISHRYIICEERDRADVVRKLIHALKIPRAIIFVHKNQEADLITRKLEHHKLNVVDIYGALKKEDRKLAMDQVRSGKVDVLIASDVAARGLDIKGLTHVINYDTPTSSSAYLHRAGRTGRAGETGMTISLISEQYLFLIDRFQKDLGISLTEVYLREGALHERAA